MQLARQSLDGALKLAIWYPYRWAISMLPPARELMLSPLVGLTLSGIDSNVRRRVAHNIGRVYPGRMDVQAIAEEFLRRQVEHEVLSITFERLDRLTLSHYLCFEGLARLDEALAEGKGCILGFPHIGPTLLPVFGLGVLGYPLVQLTTDDDPNLASPAALAAWHVRKYLETTSPALRVDARSYLRPMLRRLRENHVVMMPYDGTGGGLEHGRRVPAELLGHRVNFPVGALYLALRSGAPFLPIVTLPEKDGTVYRTIIGPRLTLEQRGDLRQTLVHNAQALAELLDHHVRSAPGCWHLWPEFEPGRLLTRS